jgi:acyl carrier protein
METIDVVRSVLRDALHLGDRAARLDSDSRLMGALPEFDSMAVVTVVTMLEDQFGITVADDELSGDVFETVGSLCRFLDGKLDA